MLSNYVFHIKIVFQLIKKSKRKQCISAVKETVIFFKYAPS